VLNPDVFLPIRDDCQHLTRYQSKLTDQVDLLVMREHPLVFVGGLIEVEAYRARR